MHTWPWEAPEHVKDWDLRLPKPTINLSLSAELAIILIPQQRSRCNFWLCWFSYQGPWRLVWMRGTLTHTFQLASTNVSELCQFVRKWASLKCCSLLFNVTWGCICLIFRPFLWFFFFLIYIFNILCIVSGNRLWNHFLLRHLKSNI